MTISVIVAAAENGVIGKQGSMLPWNIPADLARFKRLTMGHPVIMGRKTYETIGRPLPGRKNIIATRNPEYSAGGCEIAHNLDEALAKAGADEIFIIGGGELFRQALPLASRLYLTVVHATPEGDTTFEYDKNEWKKVSTEPHPADDKNEFAYTFVDLKRK